MSRPSRDFRSGSRECYDLFKQAHPEVNINFNTFRKVIVTYHEYIIEYLLETGNMVFLPRRLGSLYISRSPTPNFVKCRDGVKRNIMAIDWPKSKELGKRVYIDNIHTDGFRYAFKWRHHYSMLFPGCWKLRVTRLASRKLAKNLKEDPEKYLFLYHDWKFTPNTVKNPNA